MTVAQNIESRIGTPTSVGGVRHGRGGIEASQVVIKRNPQNKSDWSGDGGNSRRVRIATWNVRTMGKSGKLENLRREMDRCNLDIVGLCETRWVGATDFRSQDLRVLSSGGEEKRNGVALVLGKSMSECVQRVEFVSDRIIMARISAEPRDVVVIQVYMPTTDYADDEIEDMYERLEELMGSEKQNSYLILMGDWNASVGEGREGECVGPFGLGKRNGRGEKLVEFSQRHKLMVTNTWFQHHSRRRYTWKMPGDLARRQIDYIMVKDRYRNSVKNSHAYPGPDMDSDHNVVIMDVILRLKRVRKVRGLRKWDLDKLKRVNKQDLDRKLGEQLKDKPNCGNVNDQWVRLRDAVQKVGETEIGYRKGPVAKKPWVTEEMLTLMDERRKWKNVNSEEGKRKYRELNNKLRRCTDRAREDWFKGQCEEMEDLDRQGKYGLVYDRVKSLTRKFKQGPPQQAIESADGVLLQEKEEVIGRWTEYIGTLYGKDEREPAATIEDCGSVDEDNLGPQIMEFEVRAAMSDMKASKAVGVDGIPVELLDGMGDTAVKELTLLCQKMYTQGTWPEDFLTTAMIPLEKKPKATKCSDFRTISLISHAAKIMLRILNRRLRAKMEEVVSEEQFGFRQGRGTRDAVGLLKSIIQRSLDVNKTVYVGFVDLEKAFDRVSWKKLMEILGRMGVDWRDRKLIRELYWNQKVFLRTAVGDTDRMEIGRGVRQGCCLSPTLFNIYSEFMVKEAMAKGKFDGVKIGGRYVGDIRFADDMALVSHSKAGLERMLGRLEGSCGQYGMAINYDKTKVMVVGRTSRVVRIELGGHRLQQVDRFRYLGSLITADGRSCEEIKARIAMGKVAFEEKRRVLTGNLDLELRKRMMKCFVWSVMLCGAETWELRKEDIRRIEAFEMWVYRRMERVSWVDRVSNVEVLGRVSAERELMNRVRRRQRNWIGHVLRGNSLFRDVIEGKLEGKRTRGRRRIDLLSELKGGCSYQELKIRSWDRQKWRLS